jgi:hypothetical protein
VILPATVAVSSLEQETAVALVNIVGDEGVRILEVA